MLDVTAGRRTDISDSWNETSTRTRLGLDEEKERETHTRRKENVQAFERWSVCKGERELTINTTLRNKTKLKGFKRVKG